MLHSMGATWVFKGACSCFGGGGIESELKGACC